MISSASGSTYLDQTLFDPADTSQAYAVSIANNPNTPGSAQNQTVHGVAAMIQQAQRIRAITGGQMI